MVQAATARKKISCAASIQNNASSNSRNNRLIFDKSEASYGFLYSGA